MKNSKFLTILLVLALVGTMFVGCQSTDKGQAIEEEVVAVAAEEVIPYVDGSYLVDADYVKENLNNENVLILDARGADPYNKGHIPGAVSIAWPGFANVNGAPGDEGWGVVLDKETLSERLAAAGVDQNKEIIVYANTLNGWGEDGRIVWMLRMAGLTNTKMLDGGYNYWEDKKYETTTEATVPLATDFKVESLDNNYTVGTEELMNNMNDLVILDTREQDEFDGAAKFGEKRGGHLPNARLLTFNRVLNEDGTFKSANELKNIFEAAGLDQDDQIVTYCTAGIRSAHLQLALKMMGYNNVRNYDASFYEYAAKAALPLEDKIIVKGDYQYYSAEQLKKSIEAESPLVLVDIQVEDEFNAHHIKGAIATYAYPVKTEDDQAKFDEVLKTIDASNGKVVIVCPRGAGGAERTYKYMLEKGVDEARLFILENGQEGWPYKELLNK